MARLSRTSHSCLHDFVSCCLMHCIMAAPRQQESMLNYVYLNTNFCNDMQVLQLPYQLAAMQVMLHTSVPMVAAQTMCLQTCMPTSMLPIPLASQCSARSSVAAMLWTRARMMLSPRAAALSPAPSRARPVAVWLPPALPLPPNPCLVPLLHPFSLPSLLPLPHLLHHQSQHPQCLLSQAQVHHRHHPPLLLPPQLLSLRPQKPILLWSLQASCHHRHQLHPIPCQKPPAQPCHLSQGPPLLPPSPLVLAQPPPASGPSINAGQCQSTASPLPCIPPLMKPPAAPLTWTPTSALWMSSLWSFLCGMLSSPTTAATRAWMAAL